MKHLRRITASLVATVLLVYSEVYPWMASPTMSVTTAIDFALEETPSTSSTPDEQNLQPQRKSVPVPAGPAYPLP